MGILRTFIEKLETSGAVAPSATDELEPVPAPLAAAEAAMQEAIRKRQAGADAGTIDRRDPLMSDRRSAAAPVASSLDQDRRAPVGDRRGKGPAFGRRKPG